MSVTTDIYVTPSTSLVLLKSLNNVTNVYLPALNTPNFSVTIRDITGLSSLQTTPVRISTIGSANFIDGTSYYALDKPYGLVNVSLRNSTIWQINHTSGKPPATAAANVINLSTVRSIFSAMSTVKQIVSTFVVENLTTPNSISITSPFIVSNLSTPGFVLLDQTLRVKDNVLLNNTLNVNGFTTVQGSVIVEDLQRLKGFSTIVLSSVGVGGSVFIDNLLHIRSTLSIASTVQVSTLQVTLSSSSDTVLISKDVQVAGLVSSLGGLVVAGRTTVGNNASFTKEVSTLGLYTYSMTVDDASILTGTLSSVGGLGSTTSFVSSFQELSSLRVKQDISFLSSLGIVGSFYTSSFSTLGFSTFGSFSTGTLSLLSSASITGNVSTSLFQSYQYMSIGGDLFTPGSISSLLTTRIKGDVSILGGVTVATAFTASSMGVAGLVSVHGSTFASRVSVGNDLLATAMETRGFTTVSGNVGVGSSGTLYGNLTVFGEPTISSFLVNSFLLSNVQIQTSSPFISFVVSSLHASTLQTSFTRISAPLPDILTVSSTYASTTVLTNATAENARFDTVTTNSFFLGNTDSLAIESQPQFALNVKSQFAQGLSSLEVRVDTLEAFAQIQGAAIGTVDYLSNVRVPFPSLSAITTAASTMTLTNLYTSSFTASTLVVSKLANIVSTVITPYLVFESEGYGDRYDVNQFLTRDSQHMVVNRSLTFDRVNNRIGLFVSSPAYDMDISGQVYASNIYFSSINLLKISTSGTVVYSTIQVSSSYIRDGLTYGDGGLSLFSQNQFTGNTAFTITSAVSSFADTFGFFTCENQSTLFVNSALFISQQGLLGVNGTNGLTGEFVQPAHALDVTDTLRSKELYVSTVNLLQSLQTTSIVNPRYVINSNIENPLNTISASINKLSLNTIMTIQTGILESDRRVGILTLDPQCSLDVRGNAYFSTVSVFEICKTNYVAMSYQEF
jgi:hypothetical protein